MTGGKANLVCFDVNLVLILLPTLTSLSCLASARWDYLNRDYGKKSPFSLAATSVKRGATAQRQLKVQYPGFSSDQQQMHWVLHTVVPPPSLVRNRARKDGEVEPLGKLFAASGSVFCCLSRWMQAQRHQDLICSQDAYYLLFSNLNICSCMQRKDNML